MAGIIINQRAIPINETQIGYDGDDIFRIFYLRQSE
jgi:hypothetical protein